MKARGGWPAEVFAAAVIALAIAVFGLQLAGVPALLLLVLFG